MKKRIQVYLCIETKKYYVFDFKLYLKFKHIDILHGTLSNRDSVNGVEAVKQKRNNMNNFFLNLTLRNDL